MWIGIEIFRMQEREGGERPAEVAVRVIRIHPLTSIRLEVMLKNSSDSLDARSRVQ